jgi:hypothetical protein
MLRSPDLDPEMAGGAGADAAAGVVEEDVEVLGDVEKGHRLAVMFVGHGAVFEFDGLAFRQEGDADHAYRLESVWFRCRLIFSSFVLLVEVSLAST